MSQEQHRRTPYALMPHSARPFADFFGILRSAALIPQFDAAHRSNIEIVLNVDGIRVSSN
jgi:hypothetical protein